MRHAPPAPREHADPSDDPGPPPVAPPSGDEARYRALFAATYDAVLRYVERRHHPLGAEDVVAEVFLVAWRRLEDVPVPHDEARAWLCGVAQRTLADQRRGDARRRSLEAASVSTCQPSWRLRVTTPPSAPPTASTCSAPGRA